MSKESAIKFLNIPQLLSQAQSERKTQIPANINLQFFSCILISHSLPSKSPSHMSMKWINLLFSYATSPNVHLFAILQIISMHILKFTIVRHCQ
jgi:hypothetical protein